MSDDSENQSSSSESCRPEDDASPGERSQSSKEARSEVSSDQFDRADDAAANSGSEAPVAEPVTSCSQPRSYLAVKVLDYYDQPVADANVAVDGLGHTMTDPNGLVDFGEVAAQAYKVVVTKEGYRSGPGQPVGPATATQSVAAGQSVVATLHLDVFRENLIFICSEMDYDSFWLKMMFVAAARFEASAGGELRVADRKTVAFVDVGYTRFEKLAIEFMRVQLGYHIEKLASSSDVVSLFNNRLKPNAAGVKEQCALQDVAFFSHGVPGRIALNYNSSPDVDFTESAVSSTAADAFVPDGRIYSYACRTGVSSWGRSFSNDTDADPGNSLAQQMADHYRIEVHAFLTRSFYGEVLREKSDSTTIAATLKTSRETLDGSLIEIPPEHQGLPHPSLDTGFFAGSKKEGTNEYALWRKAGGIRLPRSGDTPAGLSKGLQVFKPR